MEGSTIETILHPYKCFKGCKKFNEKLNLEVGEVSVYNLSSTLPGSCAIILNKSRNLFLF